MSPAVRLRLVALGTAAALAGAAIVGSVVHFQRQMHALQDRLHAIDAETGEIAAQFRDSLREVNNARLQYAITRDPAVRKQAYEASRQLSVWLGEQTRRFNTQAEQDALRQLQADYARYLAALGDMPATARAGGKQPDLIAEFLRTRAESHHLFDLGIQLAQAHYQSRNRLIAEARQQLAALQSSVLVLVGLLFAFGAALAAVAYRDLVAPLRVKLVETQFLAERHEKLASLGMLAAGVAHEIRNPLTAVKAALFIQQKRLVPGTPEHADAELVQREISRLERIVNDFLRFARPKEPELASVPVSSLLEEVRQAFGPGPEERGARLLLSDPAPWPIRVDPGQIKQVLINLVQNALDSLGERPGTVTLRARRDRKRLAGKDRDVVVLEVEDTGSGIPPEVCKRLFDPFYTTKENGTGLGLSIAAQIVEKHHGALQYRTHVNRGTTFGVVLPQPAP